MRSKKMNDYFKRPGPPERIMPTFVYKGNTYSQMKTKTGMMVYKKK